LKSLLQSHQQMPKRSHMYKARREKKLPWALFLSPWKYQNGEIKKKNWCY
jgi:hypothetical protein